MAARLNSLSLRKRLALGGASIVALAMAASIIAFNVFEGVHLKDEAEASIAEALGWEEGDSPLASRTVNWLELVDNQQMENGHEGWWRVRTTAEEQLAQWCKDNPQPDEVRRVSLGNITCYVQIVGSTQDEGTTTLYAAYVDVTAQLRLMGLINVVLVAITLMGSATAALVGWRTGVRIEATDRMRTRFYENMSHELKTPLASIRGFAEGIEAGIMEPVASSRSIIGEEERMASLVEELLDLSRLEAGAMKANREMVAVEDLVQDCLMPFEGMIHMRGIEVDLELGHKVVSADPSLLGHALENVLSNAIRHARSTVTVRTNDDAIAVLNDGEPPSENSIAHLFDRFFTESSTGTGIGLSYAREIVELHGWSIDAAIVDGAMCVTIRMTPHTVR